MFEAFHRSWEITKLSLQVINKDRELLLYPLLTMAFTVFVLLFFIGFFIMGMAVAVTNETAANIYILVMMFLFYLVTAFIWTFFKFCTVYTIKNRFEGKNATVGSSVRFSLSRLEQIFKWAVVQATVGMIIDMLKGKRGESESPILAIIRRIVGEILDVAWKIVTLFVVQVMVYKGTGPIDSIKHSIHTVKKTWGESLIREFGVGFVRGIFIFIGLLMFIPLFILTFMSSPVLSILPFIVIGAGAFLYFTIVAIMFSLIDTVFSTALYVYAETGKVPAFNEKVLKGAFRGRK